MIALDWKDQVSWTKMRGPLNQGQEGFLWLDQDRCNQILQGRQAWENQLNEKEGSTRKSMKEEVNSMVHTDTK